jgi:hypothetical protein
VSFREASQDLQALIELTISPAHVQRLAQRFGREWAGIRDQQVQAFAADTLDRSYTAPPQVAAVMLDGGRHQTRAADAGPGVHEPAWHEFKAACCLSLFSKEQVDDPQPQPPSKFLDRVQVMRLAAELKARGRPAVGRTEKEARPNNNRRRRRKKRRGARPQQRVRTVLASTADSETFGWQVAAEVHRRSLDLAQRKGCVCDGQRYNWTIYELHLEPAGFIGILDFVHLVAYLYGAAHAACARGSEPAWQTYERWLRWAWGGQGKSLRQELRAAAEELGPAPVGVGDEDPRKVLEDTLTYVENNKKRMDYPRYRRLGLPISSAPVESVIKQLNRRIKGSEKFWVEGGAEAVLQLRAAYLSQDGRWENYCRRPRPYARAVGGGRLGRVA